MSPVMRVCAAVATVALAILVSSSPASAQATSSGGYRDAHRLGGSTSFYKPPLTNLGEGRLFLKEIDDVPNNYQFWAGVRVHF